MSILRSLYSTVVDALFPIPKAEVVVLTMDGLTALHTLPRAKKSPINESCSIFSYKDERVWRLIWALKYKKSVAAAQISAFALFQTLSMYSRAVSPIIIVPMPISKRRRRERGYNQCELIADELGKLIANSFNSCNISMEQKTQLKSIAFNKSDTQNTNTQNTNIQDSRIIIVRDLLLRTHHKSRQTLKGREERLESANDIFEVNEEVVGRTLQEINTQSINQTENLPNENALAEIFKGKSIVATPNYLLIVIDDVVTTGSTIRDAVFTLRGAGFTQTFGLSIAH